MLIPIPTGNKYTATMAGSVIKEVHCEHCGIDFVYLLEREASGQSNSPLFLDNQGAAARAQAYAEQNLEKALFRGFNLAACPACGWLQASMVRRTKWKQVANALMIWIIVSIIVPVLGAAIVVSDSHELAWTIYLWTLVSCSLLFILAIVLIVSWNHNEKAPTRAGKKNPKIMPREEFDQLLALASDMESQNRLAAPRHEIHEIKYDPTA